MQKEGDTPTETGSDASLGSREGEAEAVGRAVGGLASEMVLLSVSFGIYFGKIKRRPFPLL